MTSVGYLILAHNNPSHLARLIRRLAHDNCSFFIHVDKNVEIEQFQNALSADVGGTSVFLDIHHRISMKWGTYTQVAATLELLQAARSNGSFDRYCLLSGADFPIRSVDQIISAFATDDELLEIVERIHPSEKSEFAHRATELDLATRIPADLNFPGLTFLMKQSLGKQHGLPFFRKPRNSGDRPKIPLYKGSQWWALTAACTEYVLEFLAAHPDYVRFHHDALIPDEMFFHSIIKASPFADRIAYDMDAHPELLDQTSLRLTYVDWKRGPDHPRTLDLSDLPGIRKSKAFFARKFGSSSEALADALEREPNP